MKIKHQLNLFWFSSPVGVYLFKVNDWNARANYEIC